ncbi:MAG: hypothetical protein JJE10_03945 [Thermoleophilia bacterium]|nr:hypothetical protein [Thermoleophilia bacterium]
MTEEGGPDSLSVVCFESLEAWRGWLEENHASAEGVWLKIAKKSSGLATVTFSGALDGALCFGWVDNRKQGYDEDWYLLRFAPRKEPSNWPRINRERAERLIADGQMQSAGLRAIERARRDADPDQHGDAPNR